MHSARVRRLTVDDLMRVWELSNKASSRISPLGQQLLAAMDAAYQVVDVLTDNSVKTLRGLERPFATISCPDRQSSKNRVIMRFIAK